MNNGNREGVNVVTQEDEERFLMVADVLPRRLFIGYSFYGVAVCVTSYIVGAYFLQGLVYWLFPNPGTGVLEIGWWFAGTFSSLALTVPLGGGSGLRMDEIAEAMLEGVTAALKDAQGRPSLRSLGVATNNRNDYDHLCQSILDLAASSKFDGIEFTLDREVQENMLRTTGAQTTLLLTSAHPTTYLIVCEAPNPQSPAK